MDYMTSVLSHPAIVEESKVVHMWCLHLHMILAIMSWSDDVGAPCTPHTTTKDFN